MYRCRQTEIVLSFGGGRVGWWRGKGGVVAGEGCAAVLGVSAGLKVGCHCARAARTVTKKC